MEKIRSSAASPNQSPSDAQNLGVRSPVKLYLVIGLVTALAATSGFLLSSQRFGAGLVVLVFFIAFVLVQTLILKYRQETLLASALCAVGLMIFFLGESFPFWLSVTAILFVVMWWAHERGMSRVANMVKVRFGEAVRPGVGIVLLAITVFLSFVFFINGSFFLQEDNIGRAVDILITPVAGAYISGFSSDMTLDEALRSIATENIEEQTQGVPINKFQKDALVNEAVSNLESYIEDKTGFSPSLESSVKNNIQTYISQKSEDLSEKSRPLRALILFSILFLVVKSIEFVLYIPFLILAFVLYELFIAFGILTVQFESKSKEVINII